MDVRKLLTFLMLFWAGCACAETARLVNENLFIQDSEDADQQAHYLGVIVHPRVFERPDKLGFWYGRWQFDDPVGSEAFDAYRLTYEMELPEFSTLSLRLARLNGDDWSPWLGGATLAHAPNDRWRFEAGIERELIDSVPGIRQELTSDTITLSADWNFAPHWTLVGALLHVSVDDGNDRDGGVLRLIYSVPAVEGLTLQTRSRVIHSDFDGIGYFSPPELEEHLLLLGYTRSFLEGRWSVSALLGPGTQRFEDDFGDRTRNDLYSGELKLRGWFNDRLGLEGRAYCANSGGPNSGTPDDRYRYCSLLFSLIRSW